MYQSKKNMQQLNKSVNTDYAVSLLLALTFLWIFIKVLTP
jgi:hypothetical protein